MKRRWEVVLLTKKVQTESNAKPRKAAVLRRLLPYLWQHKGLFALAIFLVVCSNLLSLAGPYLAGVAIDAIGEVPGSVDFETVTSLVLCMIVIYVISALFSYATAALMTVIGQKVIYRMRCDVFEHLARLPVSFFDRYQTGDILSVLSYDIDTVNESLSHDILQIATSAVTIVGALVMMLVISPVLVLVFAVTIPLSILLTRFITSHTRPLFKRRSAKLGELNGYIEEMVGGQKTIKAYCAENAVLEGFDRKNDEAVDAFTRAEAFGTITGPAINFVNNLSLSLVSMFGALLFLFGRIGLGSISSFILYSRKFSGPINEIANMYGELQSSFAAAERVFRLLDEPAETPDRADAEVLTAPDGRISFHDVRFGYDPERVILHKLNMQAERGKMVAIVGPTGAGKTTIVNLIMRFYDPQSGCVKIDGKPLPSLTRDSLRASCSMVLQDTWLFHGTIYENIAYGNPSATEEEVYRAAKASHMHEYIESLPDGYNTVLSDDATNLSKGQKQLLTIARAMLIDASVLILDEATSNVDTRTELAMQDAMLALMKGKTCIVIAHRLSTVRQADCIFVMKDGDIAESGTHDELLARGGIYNKLYMSQFDE